MQRFIFSTTETDAERIWRYGGPVVWGYPRFIPGNRAEWTRAFGDGSAWVVHQDLTPRAVVEHVRHWREMQE
jgi:hypothetical protein